MTTGVRLILAAIRDGNAGILRKLNEALFKEGEVALYHFVRQHHASYGALPGVQALAEHGFSIPSGVPLTEPVAYYEERLLKRFRFHAVQETLPLFTGALENTDPDLAVDAARALLAKVGSYTGGNSASLLQDEIALVMEDYQFARVNPGMRGVTLGWPTLDLNTLGAMAGDLIVIAARPGMGKTNILLKMARSAWLLGKTGLFLSMEMPKLQIARRFLGLHTGVNPNLIRAGEVSTLGRGLLADGVASIAGAPGRLYLESGDFSRSVGAIEQLILQLAPEVLYVDAAYLLSPEGVKLGYVSRWEAVSEVIRQLKTLALRYRIPVIITVQFNRNLRNDSTKEPDLSDIAGADSIPQDASIVMGIQKPPPPFSSVRRIVTVMKSREGDHGKPMVINYRFNPVDFDEIQMIEEEEESHQTVSVQWMV